MDVKKKFRPLLVLSILLIAIIGVVMVWNQASQRITKTIDRVLSASSTTLTKNLGDLSLLSRLSSIESSLKYHSTEAVEKALNQAIVGENHLLAYVVLDTSGDLFASNSIAPSGPYVGSPPVLAEIDLKKSEFQRRTSEKYGLTQTATPRPQTLLLRKSIYYDDEAIGSIVGVIDLSLLFDRLKTEAQIPSGEFWLDDASAPGCEIASSFLEGMRLCSRTHFVQILREASLGLVSVLVLICALGTLFYVTVTADDARLRLAEQVAHDIQSPLSALRMMEPEIEQLPEGVRRLFKSVIERINDISNELRASGRKVAKGESLVEVLEEILSEKRAEYRSRPELEIAPLKFSSSETYFAAIQRPELKRVLSNLINNASEAIVGTGRVNVSLAKQSRKIKVSVADTGAGIPPAVLAQLGQRGFTYGKKEGSGLGLFHAKSTVEKWGGRLEILSEVGTGTEVALFLPTVPGQSSGKG